MSALDVRGVGVGFGGVRALDGVSLTVGPGEIVGLIGANGAGKTTLFDCLSGLVAHEGQVWVNGVDVTGLPAHERARAGLGRSFQDARLFATMSVRDVLRVAAEVHQPRGSGLFRRAAKAPDELIDRFGLADHRDALISELSTGTRRVVDLVGLVIARPAVVLLDEPSSGIAQNEAEALAPLLRQLRDDTGCALLVIEHDMPLLLSLAERMYALETGRVIATGTPAEVIGDPAVVRSYLGGDPAAIGRSTAR